MRLTIETPALLFSATSLILLAYTNRFLTIASIVRSLKKNYDHEANKSILLEIQNLNLRSTCTTSLQRSWILLHSEINSPELTRYENTEKFQGAYWWSHAVIARDWYRYA